MREGGGLVQSRRGGEKSGHICRHAPRGKNARMLRLESSSSRGGREEDEGGKLLEGRMSMTFLFFPSEEGGARRRKEGLGNEGVPLLLGKEKGECLRRRERAVL